MLIPRKDWTIFDKADFAHLHMERWNGGGKGLRLIIKDNEYEFKASTTGAGYNQKYPYMFFADDSGRGTQRTGAFYGFNVPKYGRTYIQVDEWNRYYGEVKELPEDMVVHNVTAKNDVASKELLQYLVDFPALLNPYLEYLVIVTNLGSTDNEKELITIKSKEDNYSVLKIHIKVDNKVIVEDCLNCYCARNQQVNTEDQFEDFIDNFIAAMRDIGSKSSNYNYSAYSRDLDQALFKAFM